MSSIVVSGDTSGAITIAAPAVSGTNTLTLPAATDTLVGKATTDTLTNKSIVATQLTGTIAAARLPAGSVLQVVSATLTSTVSLSGAAYQDVTGLSVSITPSSASNKVLVFGFFNGASADISYFRIVRGSTAICIGDAAGSNRIQATGGGWGTGSNATWDPATLPFSYLDSPATTSATTYKIQLGANSAISYYVNRGSNDTDSVNAGRSASTITVMEIAG
jgi:hypothetical protein